VDAVPHVTGVLEWHGLSVGDPATDLQWLASAPTAAEDVYGAYVSHSDRAPDQLVRSRARLYAELEFAKWLVHGHEAGRTDIVDDAVGLLDSLAAGVRDDDIVPDSALGVDDAIALLDRVPDAQSAPLDTSMHTDAYDPEELALWVTADDAEDAPADEPADAPAQVPVAHDDVSTAPIDIIAFADRTKSASGVTRSTDADDSDAQADAERSSDAALRRWLSE
jgi:hypothetical protein